MDVDELMDWCVQCCTDDGLILCAYVQYVLLCSVRVLCCPATVAYCTVL